jgi:hypothetical protein
VVLDYPVVPDYLGNLLYLEVLDYPVVPDCPVVLVSPENLGNLVYLQYLESPVVRLVLDFLELR